MLSWRVRRQLVALLIAGGLAALIIFSFLPSIIPDPTCRDQRQNQGEIEADCGGPCAPCEVRNPRALEVLWVRGVPVRPNTYDLAAFVQNPNEVLAAPLVEYEFSLFDGSGQVARMTGRTFLLPQERTYVIETNLTTTREPLRVEFKATKIDWEVSQKERPNIVVERREYRAEEIAGKRRSAVDAVILNRSPYDFNEVETDVVVLDADGNLLGVNQIILEDILAGARREFRSLWPVEFSGEVVTIEVEPRGNLFDPAVIRRLP